ncbi:hypothetical protein ACLI1C_15400 [Devosia sp. XGJD_8]|uniref:hypothetical protein n=1 Tax=Devosia sp. XGJD_8 TaxID=3391187 RepID=UPI0039853C7F
MVADNTLGGRTNHVPDDFAHGESTTVLGTDSKAVKLHDEVAKELTADQLKEGQQRSWNCRPGQQV